MWFLYFLRTYHVVKFINIHWSSDIPQACAPWSCGSCLKTTSVLPKSSYYSCEFKTSNKLYILCFYFYFAWFILLRIFVILVHIYLNLMVNVVYLQPAGGFGSSLLRWASWPKHLPAEWTPTSPTVQL